MRSPVRSAYVGIVVTGVVAGALFLLGTAPLLAVVTAVSWGVGLATTVHLSNRHPTYRTGGSWRDIRWGELSLIVTIVAFAGPYWLPLSLADRVALLFLLGGVGVSAFVTGMMTVLDRVGGGDGTPSSVREPSSPTAED